MWPDSPYTLTLNPNPKVILDHVQLHSLDIWLCTQRRHYFFQMSKVRAYWLL